jgi:hypothetical protein
MCPENIDVFNWIEAGYRGDSRKKYYCIKGVYAIVDGSTVLYIGSSDDMRFRLPGHTKIRIAKSLGYTSIRIMQYECDNHRSLEIGLIKKYRPLLNKEHVPGVVIDRRTEATKRFQERLMLSNQLEQLHST